MNINEIINISVHDMIIVGISNETSQLLNYCILVGQFAILQCLQLLQKYSTELFIAQTCNKLNKFMNKWKFKPMT